MIEIDDIKYLTRREVMEKLSISYAKVNKLETKYKLHTVTVGAQVLIDENDLLVKLGFRK
jgi:hypothetical protein